MKKTIIFLVFIIIIFLIPSFHDLYIEEAQLYTLSARKVTLKDMQNNEITIDPVILYGNNRQLDVYPQDVVIDQTWEKIYTLKFKSNITTRIYQSKKANHDDLTFQGQAVIAVMKIRYFGITETTYIKLHQTFYDNLESLVWTSYE